MDQPVILTNSHFEQRNGCFVEVLTADKADPRLWFSPGRNDRMCQNGLIDQRTPEQQEAMVIVLKQDQSGLLAVNAIKSIVLSAFGLGWVTLIPGVEHH